MKPPDIDKYYKIALGANTLASEYLINHFGRLKIISHKKDSHYGILEDKIANKIYEKHLKAYSPEVALYTEEGEKNLNDGMVWVVDPIEGTSNYRAGNPFWATQVSLLYNSEPLLSLINSPVLGQNFTAIHKRKSYLNNKRIKVTQETEMDNVLMCINRGTKDSDKDWYIDVLKKLLKKVRTFRNFGACSLEMAYAASGKIDLFVSKGSEIYDYFPGILMVREAGGVVYNFKGENWKIGDEGLICGNIEIVKKALKFL